MKNRNLLTLLTLSLAICLVGCAEPPTAGVDAAKARLAAVAAPIRLVVFTQTFGCDTCYEARQVADQMASLSDQITVEEHDLVLDKDEVAKYQVDQVPVIAVVSERDVGIRYYGVPAGFEVE